MKSAAESGQQLEKASKAVVAQAEEKSTRRNVQGISGKAISVLLGLRSILRS